MKGNGRFAFLQPLSGQRTLELTVRFIYLSVVFLRIMTRNEYVDWRDEVGVAKKRGTGIT